MSKFIKLNRVFSNGDVKESVFNCDSIISMYRDGDYTKIITIKDTFTVKESIAQILGMINS